MPTPAPRRRIKRISAHRTSFLIRRRKARLAICQFSRRIIGRIPPRCQPGEQPLHGGAPGVEWMRHLRQFPLAALALLLSAALPAFAAEGDVREERMIAPGVKYSTLRRAAGPQVIRVIEIERLSGYIRALPALAAEAAQALAPVSEIAARVS